MKTARRAAPWAGIGWLLFLVVFHRYQFNNDNDGGGVASKALSHLGIPGRLAFLSCGYFGALVCVGLLARSSPLRRAFIILFLVPSFAMSIVYQRYYDPVLFILFYLYLDKEIVRPFLNRKMGFVLVGFNAFLLVSAFMSNGRTKPVFLPITSSNHPWIGTPLFGKVK